MASPTMTCPDPEDRSGIAPLVRSCGPADRVPGRVTAVRAGGLWEPGFETGACMELTGTVHLSALTGRDIKLPPP
jgi:hypothetical protein